MSIPQRRAHAEFESNAVKANIKEQRRLEKNLRVLNVEEAYAMRLLDLDNRDINTYQRRMNERTAKIKSHLTTVDIIKMKELDAAGKLQGIGNKPALMSSAILAAAEKRLNIKPRPKTSLPVRQKRLMPNPEDYKRDDTNSLSPEEPKDTGYEPGKLKKQPSFSNIHQMSQEDSGEQTESANWARPVSKLPRKRPNSAFVSTSYNVRNQNAPTASSPKPKQKEIIIPTAECHDNSVSDVEDIPIDEDSVFDEPSKISEQEDASIKKQPIRRMLPVPPKRRESRVSDGEKSSKSKEINSKSKGDHKKEINSPYIGKQIRVTPTATRVTIVANDSVQSVDSSRQKSSDRITAKTSIPVRNSERKRPQTAKQALVKEREDEQENNSEQETEIPKNVIRPKTAKEVEYADIHRNRRVRSPDHSRVKQNHFSTAIEAAPKRAVSRKLPVNPDRPPTTKIPVRPITAHYRALETEQHEPELVSPRLLMRPQTAKQLVQSSVLPTGVTSGYTDQISSTSNENKMNVPSSPREVKEIRTTEVKTNLFSPRYLNDTCSQNTSQIPGHIPIAPQQRENLVQRSPRIVTATATKKLNASVVDRMSDTSILPYALPGKDHGNTTNQVPYELQNGNLSKKQTEVYKSNSEHYSKDQGAIGNNSISDASYRNENYHVLPENMNIEPNRSASTQRESLTQPPLPQPYSSPLSSSIPRPQCASTQSTRPQSARPRAPARPSTYNTSLEQKSVSTASDFRKTLSRSYDIQEEVISAKPPIPVQRPTTARNQLSRYESQSNRSSIPRPKTARMLPRTPQQRLQIDKYPVKPVQNNVIVTQAIIHEPRPPSAHSVRTANMSDQTEYITNEANVTTQHTKVTAPSKLPRRPSSSFRFDSHKIAENRTSQNDESNLKVHTNFEEAMADYLDRVAADNIFGENVLRAFQKSLIKLEQLKIAKVEDRMTLFLNKLNDYLEKSGTAIPEWFSPLRFHKTVEEPVIVTFDPATYFKNRRKSKYQHNKAAFERKINKNNESDTTWNGINKCRYLRVPNDMVDNSGVRTLATDQIQLMKTLKGID